MLRSDTFLKIFYVTEWGGWDNSNLHVQLLSRVGILKQLLVNASNHKNSTGCKTCEKKRWEEDVFMEITIIHFTEPRTDRLVCILCIYNNHVYIHIYIYIYDMYVCMYVCIYIYIYINLFDKYIQDFLVYPLCSDKNVSI